MNIEAILKILSLPIVVSVITMFSQYIIQRFTFKSEAKYKENRDKNLKYETQKNEVYDKTYNSLVLISKQTGVLVNDLMSLSFTLSNEFKYPTSFNQNRFSQSFYSTNNILKQLSNFNDEIEYLSTGFKENGYSSQKLDLVSNILKKFAFVVTNDFVAFKLLEMRTVNANLKNMMNSSILLPKDNVSSDDTEQQQYKETISTIQNESNSIYESIIKTLRSIDKQSVSAFKEVLKHFKHTKFD